ncbi:MAG: hypothetical protein V7645_2154 [Actinomycetota bacterium]|jgi:hypothetical protein
MIRKHFRLKKIALGLAFAAVVVPTAQAKVVIDGYSAPASSAAVTHQPIASEISVQSPAYQLGVGANAVQLTGAALVNAPAPVSQADSSTAIASEISVQSPAYQLGVGANAVKLTGAALVNAPAPVSHITAAGTAMANAKHAALPAGPNPVVQTASSGGFDWSDAGIGALVAFGAALMLVTAIVLGRRHRSGPTGLAST